VVNKWYFWGYLKLTPYEKTLIPTNPPQPVSVLDNLKGKNVKIKVRELSTISGRLVVFDGLFVVVEVSKNEKGKTTTETYYIPIFNIIHITPT